MHLRKRTKHKHWEELFRIYTQPLEHTEELSHSLWMYHISLKVCGEPRILVGCRIEEGIVTVTTKEGLDTADVVTQLHQGMDHEEQDLLGEEWFTMLGIHDGQVITHHTVICRTISQNGVVLSFPPMH